MTIDRKKIDVILAQKKQSISELCETMGFSRSRFFVIVNSKNISPRTAGKFADALGVDVTEIIED